ncbi:MAG: transporter substrate-binding domain-containing protein, partial [Hyphococcus sp.]
MTRLLAAAFAAVVCFTQGAVLAADLDEIRARGVLRVAVAPLSPFVIRDSEGGLTGFEIDSTKALGAHLGVEVTYVVKPFCELADAIV